MVRLSNDSTIFGTIRRARTGRKAEVEDFCMIFLQKQLSRARQALNQQQIRLLVMSCQTSHISGTNPA
jgi:hypothetical protein